MSNFIHGRYSGMTDAVVLSGIADMPEGPQKQEAYALVLGRSETSEAALKVITASEHPEVGSIQA